VQFFDDPGMDFSVRCLLSGGRDGAAEVGEILATAGRIEDGNADSWLEESCGLGCRLTEQATESAGAGRQRTAWGQALRAANYLFGGAWWAPATHRSGEVDSLWAEHRQAWDLAVSLWPTPASAESVPTPLGELPGYRFSASADGPGRGVVLMVQGLDTPLSDAAMTGLSKGLRRGWDVALVEGPGQGAALLRNGLTLAGGWDGVVAAAGRWARPDPGFPLVAMGINHGSWCVPTTKLLVRSAPLVGQGRRATRALRERRGPDPGLHGLRQSVAHHCSTGGMQRGEHRRQGRRHGLLGPVPSRAAAPVSRSALRPVRGRPPRPGPLPPTGNRFR
jgi:hypothetical protein